MFYTIIFINHSFIHDNHFLSHSGGQALDGPVAQLEERRPCRCFYALRKAEASGSKTGHNHWLDRKPRRVHIIIIFHSGFGYRMMLNLKDEA